MNKTRGKNRVVIPQQPPEESLRGLKKVFLRLVTTGFSPSTENFGLIAGDLLSHYESELRNVGLDVVSLGHYDSDELTDYTLPITLDKHEALLNVYISIAEIESKGEIERAKGIKPNRYFYYFSVQLVLLGKILGIPKKIFYLSPWGTSYSSFINDFDLIKTKSKVMFHEFIKAYRSVNPYYPIKHR